MPKEWFSMRKIKEVLRFKGSCDPRGRAIAHSCGISRSMVAEYLRLSAAAGLTWPPAEELDDAALEALLFPPLPSLTPNQWPQPDWTPLHRSMATQDIALGVYSQVLLVDHFLCNPASPRFV